MQHCFKSELISISKDSSPILLCLNCKQLVPNIQLLPSSGKMDIITTCPCTKGSKTQSLREYITKLKEKCQMYYQKEDSAKCTGWLCNKCEKHLLFAVDQKVIQKELIMQCSQHRKAFAFYCRKCRINICVDCTQQHQAHTLMKISLSMPCKPQLGPINSTLENIRVKYYALIERIDQEIRRLTQMKKEFESIYLSNEMINNDLKQLHLSLCKTSFVFEYYPSYELTRLKQTIIQNREEMIDYQNKRIEREMTQQKKQLLNFYILNQKATNARTSTFSVDNNPMVCSVLLPDERLVINYRENTIAIWNIPITKCLATLRGHNQPVTCLSALDNQRLASGSYDMTIKLWSTTTNECIATLRGHTDEVKSLTALSHNRLASCSEDKTIRIWSTLTNECIMTITGHWQLVNCVIELTNGQLASGSDDKTIKIWEKVTNRNKATLRGHTNVVLCLIQLTDGRLVSGSGDKTIKLWNTSTNTCIETLKPGECFVKCLAELTDGRLVSGFGNGNVQIWNTATYQKITLPHEKSRIFCPIYRGILSVIEFSNGSLASFSEDGMEHWDI